MRTYDYYHDAFPFELIGRMFSQNGPLSSREFAFECGEGKTEREQPYHKRYISMADASDWKREVRRNPRLLAPHVGPIYSAEVQKPPATTTCDEDEDVYFRARRMRAFILEGPDAARKLCLETPTNEEKRSRPARKELFFDVDCSDYALGVDKQSTQSCDRAWAGVAFAIDVVSLVMRECFGYSQFCAFYSGKKGAHLWVLDPAAAALTDEQRKEILNFITLEPRANTSNNKQRSSSVPSHLFEHPNFESLVRLALDFFEEYGVRASADGGLGLLDTKHDVDVFCNLVDLNSPALKSLNFEMLARPDGVARWRFVQRRLAEAGPPWYAERVKSAVLTLVWPRLDRTLQLNHLGKSPFAVHKSTGRVAVPIPLDRLYAFRPSACPTIQKLHFPAHRRQFDEILSAFADHLDALPPGHAVPLVRGEVSRPESADDDPDDYYTVISRHERRRKLVCKSSPHLPFAANAVAFDVTQALFASVACPEPGKRVYTIIAACKPPVSRPALPSPLLARKTSDSDLARRVLALLPTLASTASPVLLCDEGVVVVALPGVDPATPQAPVPVWTFQLDARTESERSLKLHRLAYKIGRARLPCLIVKEGARLQGAHRVEPTCVCKSECGSRGSERRLSE